MVKQIPFPYSKLNSLGEVIEHSVGWSIFLQENAPDLNLSIGSNVRDLLFKHNIELSSITSRLLNNKAALNHVQCKINNIIFAFAKNTLDNIEDGLWVGLSVSTETEDSQLTDYLIENERQKILAELAGSIAHEVNNPMTVIYMKMQTLERLLETKQLTEQKLSNSLEVISRNAKRVVKIVKGMRSLASFNSPENMTLLNAEELFDEAILLLTEEISNSGVKVDIHIQSDIPMFPGRTTQILQTLIILIKNAIESASSINRPLITLQAYVNQPNIYLSVDDNGPGIRKEDENKVFSPFYSTKGAKGSGLGLSIARKVISYHSGLIYINRKISDSCFTIQLPLNQDIDTSDKNQQYKGVSIAKRNRKA